MKIKRIKDLREDHDLTQTAVGDGIGISQRLYSYYERGERSVPPEILIALSDYYKTSVDYILGRTDNPKVIKEFFKTEKAVPDKQ